MPAGKLEILLRTFNHEGPLNRILHLFGDKHHVEHHLYPHVPQYHLDKLNRLLLGRGLGAYMQYRGTVLGEPKRYCDVGAYGNDGKGNGNA